MPWLKGLVVALAVSIVAGMAALLYGFATKLGKPPALASKPFGTLDLALPEGCVIAAVSPAGDRLYLSIGPAGSACERVVVVDAARGSVLGEIRPRP